MKPPTFAYHRATTVAEAARLLAELEGDAKVLAGGQSLVPLLNFRLAVPDHLVDINHVDGLDRVDVRDGLVHIGATVRHAALLADEAAGRANPLLPDAVALVAHGVIRNRGTVVGSLAHGDPAAELPAVLLLLGGTLVTVAWRDGTLHQRSIAAADLYVGPLMTTIGPDELAVAATVPALGPATGSAILEHTRRHGDYAIVGVAATVAVDPAGEVLAARAAYLGCGPTPVAVDLGPGPLDPAALARLVGDHVHPTDDIHASARHRAHLAAVLTAQAVDRATTRARARVGAQLRVHQ